MEHNPKEARRPKVRVSFRWDCREVKSTEEVRVTGNCEELGSWIEALFVPYLYVRIDTNILYGYVHVHAYLECRPMVKNVVLSHAILAASHSYMFFNVVIRIAPPLETLAFFLERTQFLRRQQR